MKKIAIMGAMPEEVDGILELMQRITVVEHAGRNYHCGMIHDIEVVLVFSRWGKVAASSTATTLIDRFGAEALVFTGVAGAISADLNMGDVVIADQLYQHDMDASPFFPKHEIPLTGQTFYLTHASLRGLANDACKRCLTELHTKLSSKQLEAFGIQRPQCRTGTIASGDQFISSSQLVEALRKSKPETLAVEMEGAAVAQVCNEHQVPFVIVRTISDSANHEAEVDFPAFIASIAKHYSQSVINYMLAAMVPVESGV